jgi:ubiquitin carboxyl-terminal hydrolase 47
VCRGLVEQYVRDGPLVYELYSILVHSGTANAGHYFSYIRSPDNNRWYLFNDERVNEITPSEIEKSFGGKGGAANAYVLYYRLYEEERFKGENQLPEYIVKAIREEEAQREQRQAERIQNLESVLVLKVYMNLAVSTIEMHKDSSFGLLAQKSAEMFNIRLAGEGSEPKQGEAMCLRAHNVRLRLYNPASDIKLDTFTGREQQSLSELGIRSYQSLLLEVKGEEDEFEEFVAGFMSIRVALWEDNPAVRSLDEKHLRLHK